MGAVWISFVAWFAASFGGAVLVSRALSRLATVYPTDVPVAAAVRPRPVRAEHPPAHPPATAEEQEREELRRIAAERDFTAHYQPIVDLTEGGSIGVEALTRFSDGIRPDLRFRRAGQLGVGTELELATLQVAIENAALLPDDGFLAVNMSPSLITGEAPLRELLDVADRPLVVELSEQEAVQDYDELREALDRLGLNIRLSVDDAGSGFSSLRHILLLHPAYVKFDRAWVHDVHQDPARRALIAGLRHFADTIGATLVAEGIEKQEERETLVDLGVAYGQGWLVGRPQPAA